MYNAENDTYIETLVVNNRMVNVFADDYGQCFWFQWLEDGELKDMSCGTYNLNYKQEIEDFFKPETTRLRETVIDLRQQLRDLQREFYKYKKKHK